MVLQNINTSLENYFFYRLIRVLYAIILICAIGWLSFTIYLDFYNTTFREVNDQRSYILCNNGEKYSFENINSTIDPNLGIKQYDQLDCQSDMAAKEICSGLHIIKNKDNFENAQTYTTFADLKIILEEEERGKKRKLKCDNEQNNSIQDIKKNYKVQIYYYWTQSGKVWLGSLFSYFCYMIFIYLFLNLTRETLLYLAYGKKFSWLWLKKIRLF